MSLHKFLTRLIWLCVLPLVLLTVYLAADHIDSHLREQDRDARVLLQSAATALDRNLWARISALQVLASSPLVDPANRHELYQQALGFRDIFDGQVVLADPSMQMLFNTRVPYGSVLPKLPVPKGHAAAPAALSTGKPAVGDLFFGPIAQQPLVAVAVPILRRGQPQGLLLSIVDTQPFQQRFETLALPTQWSLRVLDSQGNVITSRPSPEPKNAAERAEKLRTFSAPLTNAPWSVVLEIPRDVYYAPIFATAAALLLAVLFATLASVFGGRAAGHRLARAMATLGETAVLEKNYPIILEIEAVRSVLAEGAATRKVLEKRFRELLDNVQLIAVLLDENGRVTYTNDYLLNLSGHSRQQLFGIDWFDRMIPDANPEAKAEFVRGLQNGEIAAHFENPIITADGSIRNIHWNNTVLRDATGQIRGTASLGEDITERKQAENALDESRKQLQAILDNTPALIYVKDLEGRLILVNRSFEVMFNLSSQELLGKTSHDLLPQELADAHRANDLMIMAKRAAVSMEEMNDEADGRHTYLTVKFPLFDSRGELYASCGISTDISTIKQAEAKLQREKQIFRLFVEHSPAAIAMFDQNMRYLAVSRRFLQDYGLPEQDLIGRSHYELFPEIPERWKQIHRRCLAGATEKCDQEPFLRINGGQDWVRWEIRPWREASGEIGGIILFSEVITARVEAAARLSKSETRIRAIFEQASDGIYIISAENRYLDANQRGLELLGYRRDELLQLGVADVLAPQEQARLAVEPPRVMAGERHLAEWEMVRKDGSRFPGEVSAGRLDEYSYLAIVRDLTERRRTEQELRQTYAELQSINRILTATTGKQLQEMLENVLSEALAGTGLEGGAICLVKPGDYLQLATQRGLSAAMLAGFSDQTIRLGDCLCGQCAQTGRPQILRTRQEVLDHTTSAALREEAIHFHADFPLMAGTITLGVLCVFSSSAAKPTENSLKMLENLAPQVGLAIENAQLLETLQQHGEDLELMVNERTRELRVANQKLQELDRLKSLFIASMSHELRTPLNSIIGFSSILRDEWLGPVNAEQKENLVAIFESGKLLLALINDMIDLSKIESGLLEIRHADFELAPLVAEAVKLVEKDAQDKQIGIHCVITPLIMHSDRRRLLQCLLNLLSNAVKFSSAGNISVTARPLGSGESERVEIVVTDSGIGIQPEELPQLFTAFVRLHPPGGANYPGTGLGLYLVRKLVREVLHGEVTVSSEYGVGSRFTLRLPVRLSRNERG